jgi:hypothetical protein
MISKRLSVIVNPFSGRGRGLQFLDRFWLVLDGAVTDSTLSTPVDVIPHLVELA